ncbi:hypothetical protein H112_00997 [Trichophyton rubrum D6]|uniref:Uncharacterized protein n=3 Tax=Trichophyton TaxID=5550 RepID=A0A080WP94_TRIRC|nr:uncharacterized protein TERG_12544 [Trichophyton rubrum CBS 118892]EZF26946.1 hypothetical protein H100_00997 [Trichophyton rubrum MR850]EZF45986.1 hypothetical protein H102_00988 [Trichophyton rubrum CBS 100081]EZF56637.1 hypothetical protein H103_00997 [Trichophyton rubrum CBS 288.86]EZF67297.1 hypothetical protein H104_00980 [Trichophyton rubrum CBS 289.86]EZF77946.1 hypothetical protein H105_00994 [Trichophyton soudanense CBS 452.61]EZF88597.1 hypothetical protein H110_00997 [Trichophy
MHMARSPFKAFQRIGTGPHRPLIKAVLSPMIVTGSVRVGNGVDPSDGASGEALNRGNSGLGVRERERRRRRRRRRRQGARERKIIIIIIIQAGAEVRKRNGKGG